MSAIAKYPVIVSEPAVELTRRVIRKCMPVGDLRAQVLNLLWKGTTEQKWLIIMLFGSMAYRNHYDEGRLKELLDEIAN
jgi:hypothetical protein